MGRQGDSYTYSAIILKVVNPIDHDTIDMAWELSSKPDASVRVVALRGATETETPRITIWSDEPDQPALRALADRISGTLDIAVVIRRTGEAELV